ncbi:MAG: hypothetical protein M3296_02160 [Actinomycetota bacterium]|nr:hypothetical protein [Actinomycetota bacterium]
MVVLGAAVAGILILTSSRGRPDPPIARDLERLASTDGLYTAPQIKAQAGDALAATAYAHASLRLLGAPLGSSRPSARTVAQLHPHPLAGPIEQAWLRMLLRQSHLDGPRPSRQHVLRLWSATERADVTNRLVQQAQLADLSREARMRARELPRGVRRDLRETLRRTRGANDPRAQLARAELVVYAGLREDAGVARVAARRALTRSGAETRALQSAAIVESAVVLGRPLARRVLSELCSATRRTRSEFARYAALRALHDGGASPAPLAGLVARIRRALGPRGAIAENAVFPSNPKAVWLVAHLRRAVGDTALPDARVVRLSHVLASPDPSLRSDPDAYGLLLAAGRLAGLSYSTSRVEVPLPPPVVHSTAEALTWAQRARVASDLRTAVARPTVVPWRLAEDVDIGALGALLHVASVVHAAAQVPAAFREQFATRARRARFRTVRWRMQAAAGLVAIGRRAAARAIVRGRVGIGCSRYAHLVRDSDGTCDLESTLLLVEVRDDLPVARRLVDELEKP